MIIRRKHTANFTTIGNALLNDKRLKADEVGILVYLLSQPHDWEVRRPALARRWDIGRDGIKRIMLNLICTGWIVARKTRLPNGTFFTVYEVRDEPGPSLSIDEAKAATSLVSSDADPADSENDGDEPQAAEPGRPTDPPDTGQPDTGEPDTANPSWPYKNLQNTDSEKTESPNRVRAFERVLAGWPPDHVLSSVAAGTAFAGLTDGNAKACEQGVKPYLEDCRAQSRKVCDLTTYIREMRWERLLAKAKPALVSIKPMSIEFHRWREYRVATGDQASVRALDLMAKMGRDITVPSQWPPGLPPKADSSAA